MRREPSLPAAILIALWMVADAWLVYGVMSWALIRLG